MLSDKLKSVWYNASKVGAPPSQSGISPTKPVNSSVSCPNQSPLIIPQAIP